MKHFSLKALAFSTFLTTMTLGAAVAQDANAVAERLKGVLAAQGMEIAWTGVSGGGDTVVLDGVTIKATNGGAGEVANLGQVTLSGIVEENGGFTIGTVAVQDYTGTEDDTTVSVTGISLTNLVLPAEGTNDPMSMLASGSSRWTRSISRSRRRPMDSRWPSQALPRSSPPT
jgi:hypothetical protein